jgi:hypothetical protein
VSSSCDHLSAGDPSDRMPRRAVENNEAPFWTPTARAPYERGTIPAPVSRTPELLIEE